MRSPRQISPLDFASVLEGEMRKRDRDIETGNIARQAEDRVRNALGLRDRDPSLSPTHRQLAEQYKRVIRGDRLNRKTGPGRFSLPRK